LKFGDRELEEAAHFTGVGSHHTVSPWKLDPIADRVEGVGIDDAGDLPLLPNAGEKLQNGWLMGQAGTKNGALVLSPTIEQNPGRIGSNDPSVVGKREKE